MRKNPLPSTSFLDPRPVLYENEEAPLTLGIKAMPFYILRILAEYSDADHPLTQKEIIDKIKLYDPMLEPERKSVGANIKLLRMLGYGIERSVSNKPGFYLLNRDFEPYEIRCLVDALFSSKSIDGNSSYKLSEKLVSYLGKYERKDYNYIRKSEEITRTSQDVFLPMDIVLDAINRGKKVSFRYFATCDENGNITEKYQGYRYKVSPYHIVHSDGNYYLICNVKAESNSLSHFRLDRIREARIEESEATPIEVVAEGFDVTDYINEHVYFLNENVVDAVLEPKRPQDALQILDRFGEEAKKEKVDGKLRFHLRCDEWALVYWIMRYSSEVKVIAPSSTRAILKGLAEKMMEEYEDA